MDAALAYRLVYALTAVGFLLLGRVISGANLWQLIDRLAAEALWVLQWGIYAAAAFLLALLVGGFFVQTRWLVGLTVAILAVASAVVVVTLSSGTFTFGNWLFLLPALLSLVIGAWLAVDGWPRS